jgi:DNA-binding response OmpR family regulator
VLRWTEQPPDPGDVVRAGEVNLDVLRRQVGVGGRAAEFTPTKVQFLDASARARRGTFTRAQLLYAAHIIALESDETPMYPHVKNIYCTLEPDPQELRYLLTACGASNRVADDEV